MKRGRGGRRGVRKCFAAFVGGAGFVEDDVVVDVDVDDVLIDDLLSLCCARHQLAPIRTSPLW